MKLIDIYNLFVKLGRKADPRDDEVIDSLLKKAEREYRKLDKKEKEFFDKEKLKNPYSDTRILFGDPQKEVKCVMVGIDIDASEVLLADRLIQNGTKIDAIISHHPEGKAWASLDDVMHLQADLLNSYGVPINIAEGVLSARISEVSRLLAPANHNKTIDVARMLGIPFMTSHTVADNMVFRYVQNVMDKRKPQTVGDIIDLLRKEPEYKEAMFLNAGPRIFVGSPERRAGKIAVLGMTGGTEGAKEIYEKMAQAGIGTTIDMHMSEEHKKEAEKHHINVVIAGHIASDSLGMNLLLDEIEKKGVKIIPVGGLIRAKRK